MPVMRKIGYARVSTKDQNLDLQIHALQSAGCTTIFEDHGVSGSTAKRPGLSSLTAELKPGDKLVIWKLDRLGRSTRHLLSFVSELKTREIDFQSLNECIDTESATGNLLFQMMAAFAEFERNQLSERTVAGIEAARRRGQPIGRPRALTASDIEQARHLVERNEASIPEIAERYGVERTTMWRALKAQAKEKPRRDSARLFEAEG